MKLYRYFVVYEAELFNGSTVTGRVFMQLRKLNTMENIIRAEKIIKKDTQFRKVMITNFKRIKSFY